MAPTSSVTFYDSRKKENYNRTEDLYGAIFMVSTIREKSKIRSVTKSNRDMILTRLRKNTNSYEKFKSSCPVICISNISVIELKYGIRINIWYQKHTTDVPVLALASGQDASFDDLNLLSKTFTDVNMDLT